MNNMMSKITQNLNGSRETMAIFLDLARAFDTVSNIQLIDILEYYGVRSAVLDVFSSYSADQYP